MTNEDFDLLSIRKGAVTAPAGCGKTHLIAEALARHNSDKPILVLTHTNAGVVALRNRLNRAKVPNTRYRLSTIDGWAMSMIQFFPKRSGHDPDILKVANPRADYPNIRRAALNLLNSKHIDDVIMSSYDRLFVDEYQDCMLQQHAIICRVAALLPTCVLGDPMQAIFGFQGDELHWDNDVCNEFPVVGELATPWRWKNMGKNNFGAWLLSVRKRLIEGLSFDIREAPAEVRWIQLDGARDDAKRIRAASTQADSVLVIGYSKNPQSQQRVASRTPGAQTVESVDLKDLIAFAGTIDFTKETVLQEVLHFAENVMTNVGASDILKRVNSLESGKAIKPASELEDAALACNNTPSVSTALELLVEIGKQSEVRQYRPTVLMACANALRRCIADENLSFHEAALREKEQLRTVGRPLPPRAVGSTLLLKGLEADIAVVLDADTLDSKNLYVAMTRGAEGLFICSKSPLLPARS